MKKFIFKKFLKISRSDQLCLWLGPNGHVPTPSLTLEQERVKLDWCISGISLYDYPIFVYFFEENLYLW